MFGLGVWEKGVGCLYFVLMVSIKCQCYLLYRDFDLFENLGFENYDSFLGWLINW